MANPVIKVTPEGLDLELERGDDASLQWTFTSGGVPVTDLPSTGWKAQVRAKPTNASNLADAPVLMEFAIDTSDIATGVIRLSWNGDDIDALPKRAYWDLQNDAAGRRTYVGGVVISDDQVTR